MTVALKLQPAQSADVATIVKAVTRTADTVLSVDTVRTVDTARSAAVPRERRADRATLAPRYAV